MSINRVWITFLLVIVAVFTAAIFSYPVKAGATITVEITNFKFNPAIIEVKSGDSVVFVNRDIVPHTATADDKRWDTGLIAKDESKTIEIVSDMTLTFFCLYHPNMKASFSYVN